MCVFQSSGMERYHMSHIQEKVREDVAKLYFSAKQAFLSFRLCNAILHTCKKLMQPLQEVSHKNRFTHFIPYLDEFSINTYMHVSFSSGETIRHKLMSGFELYNFVTEKHTVLARHTEKCKRARLSYFNSSVRASSISNILCTIVLW